MTPRSHSVMKSPGTRTCNDCQGKIKKGELHFNFSYGSSYYTVQFHLCAECFSKIGSYLASGLEYHKKSN